MVESPTRKREGSEGSAFLGTASLLGSTTGWFWLGDGEAAGAGEAESAPRGEGTARKSKARQRRKGRDVMREI